MEKKSNSAKIQKGVSRTSLLTLFHSLDVTAISSRLYATVAQSVEQVICNHQVAGSSPVAGPNSMERPP